MLENINSFYRTLSFVTVSRVKSFKYDDIGTMSPEQLDVFLTKNYNTLAKAYNRNQKQHFLTKEESIKCDNECSRIKTIKKLAGLKEAGDRITSAEVQEIIDLGIISLSLSFNYFRAAQLLSDNAAEELKDIFPSEQPKFREMLDELIENRKIDKAFDEEMAAAKKAGLPTDAIEEKYGIQVYFSSGPK